MDQTTTTTESKTTFAFPTQPPTMRDVCTAIMDAAKARAHYGFTTDDVSCRLLGYYHPEFEPRSIGVGIRKLSRDGKLLRTSIFRNSIDPICHGRPKRVWVLA